MNSLVVILLAHNIGTIVQLYTVHSHLGIVILISFDHRKQDGSHQWSIRPAHCHGWQYFRLILIFDVLDGRTDGRNVKIAIATGLDCGWPRGSKQYLLAEKNVL